MIKLYNKDNIDVLKSFDDKIKFKIIYIDPPYNTGNKFNYVDKMDKNEWFDEIDKRLNLIKEKQLLTKNGCVIFSISEESLLPSLMLLNKYFKNVFPPFCWLTKSILNQNKVNTVNSVVHEYIIVASDDKIVTNLEDLSDLDMVNEKDNKNEILEEKYKNYPLSFYFLNKPSFIGANKDYLCFNENDFMIINHLKEKEENVDISIKNKHNEIIEYLKDKYNLNLNNQIFQKRTVQKGHGSERYYNNLIDLEGFNPNNLYCLLNVKDKNNLNGKFLLNNSYFQSIQKENVKIKIPSFLGFYQSGLSDFQTAKPVNLIKRIFKAFSNNNDCVLDLYSGSGNVLKAGNEMNRNMIGIEIDNDKTLKVLKRNLKDIGIEIF